MHTSLRLLLTIAACTGTVLGCSESTVGEHDSGLDSAIAIDASSIDAPSSDARPPSTDGPSSDAVASDAGQALDGSLTADAAPIDGGPPVEWDNCSVTSTCTLVPSGCCATCADPELADVHAVSTAAIEAHYAEVCPVPMPCPRCATRTNPDLIATCASNECEAVDVSLLPLSACETDADCFVRYATCCGCSGEAWQLVGLRGDRHGALDALLCDEGSCPTDCIPREEEGYVARCDTVTRHCTVEPL